MATPNNISSKGTIENLLNQGFTLQDAKNELVDNSFDAGAKQVRIRLTTPDHTFYLDDDAKGMTMDMLLDALCINHTKPASESIGLRGVGLKAGHAVLSNEVSTTRIFSKHVEEDDICEVKADWPKALAKDVWNPTPTEVSSKRLSVWESGCLTPSHGTVTMIPMPVAWFSAMIDNLPQVLKGLGRTYEAYLNDGKRITVLVDGVEYLPDMSMAVGWETTPAHLRNEVRIEVWRNPETRTLRVYHEHTSLRPIWTDMVRPDPANPKKMLRDYPSAGPSGFVCTGRFLMRSVYNPAWNPPQPNENQRPAFVPGYIAFRRSKRALRPIPMETPTAGDYERRRIVGCSRHTVDFDYTADALVGVQVNKSNVTTENICPELLATVKHLALDWASKVYETNYKSHVEREDMAFERRLKRVFKDLKDRATESRDGFLEVLEDVITEWDAQNDQ